MSLPAAILQRRAAIIACWLVAAGLIAAQWFWRRSIPDWQLALGPTDPNYVICSPDWRFWGGFAAALLIYLALAIRFRWGHGRIRSLVVVGLLALVPASCAGVIGEGFSASRIDSVRLASGEHYILAIEPVFTDSVYVLYRGEGPLSIYWRSVTMLDYSEDGRFTGGARLVVTPDERWMLVTRAGVWTDCLRITDGQPAFVDVQPYPDWNSPDYEANMHLRSRRIAQLARLNP